MILDLWLGKTPAWPFLAPTPKWTQALRSSKFPRWCYPPPPGYHVPGVGTNTPGSVDPHLGLGWKPERGELSSSHLLSVGLPHPIPLWPPDCTHMGHGAHLSGWGHRPDTPPMDAPHLRYSRSWTCAHLLSGIAHRKQHQRPDWGAPGGHPR